MLNVVEVRAAQHNAGSERAINHIRRTSGVGVNVYWVAEFLEDDAVIDSLEMVLD